MPKKIEIAIVSAYDAKGSAAARKDLADLTKAGNSNSAAVAKQAAAYAKAQAAAAQAATSTQKLATAQNTAAVSAQKLATEQQRTATQSANAARAQTQAQQAALRYAQAQDKAAQASNRANSGMAVLPRTIAGLSHEAASFATASLSMGAAVGVATATVNSFADAFKFKADLDATTLAVNAQLQGMRDSSQVWNEASAFAQKFKLTQQETTQAISASIGVMRSSKAPVEDILGVLARMQVLSPEQSLQEAAIALKALASGDTTSLVTRFEVSRDVANQMKAEIQGGADAVAVMSKFLGETGIGMDVLAAKTEGASGKLKDLAIAQEQLKFAQAEFAQGPGMAILEGQIKVTQDATKALGGDFQALNAIINDSGLGTLNPILGALGAYNDAVLSAGKSALEWAGALQTTDSQVAANAAGASAYAAEMERSGSMTQANTAYEAAYAASLQSSALAQQDQSSATNIGTTAFGAYQQAVAVTTTAINAESQALVDETQKKFASAVEAEKLAKFQADLANLGGAVAGGLMTAGNAAGQLAQMYGIATSEALKLIQAQAALAQAKVNAAALSDQRSGERSPGTSGMAEAAAKEEAKEEARLQQVYKKLVTVSATGGRAIGAARTSAAGAAATKLEGIEQKTGDKLSQIVQDTQAKLIAIDQKAADERARIAQELNNKLATSAADRRASTEADDLDLIGVTDEKEAQKLNDRERAQAAAREREVAAAKEAQDAIANGEAESASKVYDIRQKQIGDQQALDEKYAERQRELAGNDEQLAALKQQYDEGTRANEEAANTRIAIAKAESAQKAAEVQAEKDAVIAAANEQANQVVSAAERSAQGVTKATGTARATAVANLKAIGDAVTAIPSQKTITISVNQQGTVGASSGTKAAGGGTFVTAGKAHLTVGDNPGGRELVTVTPLSGRGRTRVGRNMIAMAGGGVIDAGGGYTTPIAGAPPASPGKGKKGKAGAPAAIDPKKALDEMKNTIQLLMDMARLKEQIAELASVPAFDIPLVQALVDRAQQFTAYVASKLVPLTKAEGEALGRYLGAAKDAASLIGDMASLKKDIAELKNVPAFDQATVLALIDRAEQFTRAVQGRLIPLTEFERDQIGRYTEVVGDVVGMLKDVADLKKELAEPAPPIDTRYIDQLIADAAIVTVLMRERLVGTTEEQADAVGRYAAAVGDTVSILNDVLSLRAELKDASPVVITDAMIEELAYQAQRIATLVSATLIPTTEEQADGLGRYASAVGDSISILSDVLGLGNDLKDGMPAPISDAMIIKLADQGVRIATLTKDRLIPTSEEQAKALSAYADLVGSSVSALSDVASLSGKLFTDYTSPTDAQIALLATDAKRITDGFFRAGELLGKEGAEAGKAYAEGVGAAFSAAKEGLLVIDALKSGDFVLPQGALRQFESSSLDILSTMQALGARAAQIPAADIAALQNVTSAISGQAEAMIRLAAVPFGDLGGVAGGFSGTGGATTTIYNTWQISGSDPNAVATIVMQRMNQQMKAHR
jgi:hypothetical protein